MSRAPAISHPLPSSTHPDATPWMRPTARAAELLEKGLSASFPRIETKRLILSVPDTMHLDLFLTLVDEDDRRGRNWTSAYNVYEAWDEFCMIRGRWALRGTGLFAVSLKDGTPIGFCGIDREPTDPLDELGWIFLEAYHRQGYAYEAACAAREFAHQTLQLAELVSCVWNRNTASMALARKLGAIPDRTLEDDLEAPGMVFFRHPEPEAAL